MSTLKFFGFTLESLIELQQNTGIGSSEIADAEELLSAQSDSQVWVVALGSREHFVRIAPRYLSDLDANTPTLPPAILWVTNTEKALLVDVWFEDYYAQLEANNPEDCIFLARIDRCNRVLPWRDRLDMVLSSQRGILGRTAEIDWAALPIDHDELDHLYQCQECQEEVRIWLRREALLNNWICCPTAEAIAAWLEGPQNAELEAHLRDCTDCQESVEHQAWLWSSAGLISKIQADTKLTSAGIRVSHEGAWLKAAIEWQADLTAKYLIILSAFNSMSSYGQRSSNPMKGETELPLTEALRQQLVSGDPVSLADKEHWLLLRLQGTDLLIRAGRNSADRFAGFRLEFRRQSRMLLSVDSNAGVVTLTPAHFQQAMEEQADEITVHVNAEAGGVA